MEIERKFFVDKTFFKNIVKNDLKNYKIIQYYVRVGDVEERYRMKGKKFYHTIKGLVDGGLVRQENETRCESQEFYSNYGKKIGNAISKTRYEFVWGGKKFKFDEYSGKLKGLIVCEIEFDDIQDAMDFNIPSFCMKEITFDERYKNQNLALKGLPSYKGNQKYF